MADNTGIEWTDATWNPVTGCTKISPGCKHCYAERMANRLIAMGQPNYANGFKLTMQPEMLALPLRWKKPRMVFVNSMSDLFHEEVPLEYIQRVFKVMNVAGRHTFQVLTKRAKRLAELSAKLCWTENIWMGVSIENRDYEWRIQDLVKCGAKVKFLSIEPLIGPVSPKMNLHGIDWVIVGGESGPGCRPMEANWVRAIRDRCIDQQVPFFFKQWGGVNKHVAGRVLDGRTWDEMPGGRSVQKLDLVEQAVGELVHNVINKHASSADLKPNLTKQTYDALSKDDAAEVVQRTSWLREFLQLQHAITQTKKNKGTTLYTPKELGVPSALAAILLDPDRLVSEAED